jgi:conserved oligomeric Golgi complex subunit 2
MADTRLDLPCPTGAGTGTARPTSSYSGFLIPSAPSSRRSSASSSGSTSDDAPLPFPAALSRRNFLAPDFDAASYLSSLHTGPTARHQTLEDLRAELRDRSAAISGELLELVNANYTSFLGLGDELRGGEDRVEDVRVALLGFRRAVAEVQSRVRERRVDVGRVVVELGQVKGAVETGRRMLELDERVEALEGRLVVGSLTQGRKGGQGVGEDGDGESWEGFDESDDEEGNDEGEDDAAFVGSSPTKLGRLARDYMVVESIADSLGRDLPYVRKMEERMMRCRNTILLDLSTALKEARRAGSTGQKRVLTYLAVYRTLGAPGEATRVLKER